MQLTKQQVAVLKRYQMYRGANPTFLGVVRRIRPWRWVVLAVGVGFGLLAVAPQASPPYGWFLFGFIAGIVYISFMAVLRSVRNWPMSREIIDWNRVDDLVRENENR